MRLASWIAATGLALASPATAATLYSETFESGPPANILGGGGITSVQGYEGQTGISGNFWRNSTNGNPATATTVSLTGLAAHSEITLGFSLAMIDTWDSVTNPPFGPDFFNVTADGVSVLSYSWDDVNGYLTPVPSSVVETFAAADYGFDSTLDYGGAILVSFSHSGATLDLSFFASGAGWQGGGDESWAIDSLVITSNAAPVPLPAGGVLLLGALAALGLTRRRR